MSPEESLTPRIVFGKAFARRTTIAAGIALPAVRHSAYEHDLRRQIILRRYGP
jgi:hypothetical protein